jgi:hypothetical protein
MVTVFIAMVTHILSLIYVYYFNCLIVPFYSFCKLIGLFSLAWYHGISWELSEFILNIVTIYLNLNMSLILPRFHSRLLIYQASIKHEQHSHTAHI